tara:strand:- start:122 stop:2275 length:2154 start_codon:yes stop_codon:yes gene_type:complete
MRAIWYSLCLLGILLLFSSPTEAEKYADTEFFLDRDGVGNQYDLTVETPSGSNPKYWRCSDDPNQANTFFPLAYWEMFMNSPLEIGDTYSYSFWVESTNVQEISFRTTLYIEYFGEYSNISVDEVSKTAGFEGGQYNWLNENYTMDLESSQIDQSFFPNGVPPYSTLGINLETSITWAPDTENRTVWIKAANSDFPSSFILDLKYIDIDTNTTDFVNNRVDEINEDSLFIRLTATNALGEENFDTSSAVIEIEGVDGGGVFRDSIEMERRHSYAQYIQGYWWYQEDNNIESGNYFIKVSVKDVNGNTWTSRLSYYLEVDQYGLEINFDESDSPNGQLPKGGKTVFSFNILNAGNTKDIFLLTLDDSDLPSGWEATILSDSSIELEMGQSQTVRISVEAPVSATGGSSEKFVARVTSTGNDNIFEEVKLEVTVRTYGVSFFSVPDKISIDPYELDVDGYYKFKINIRNEGSDRDTFEFEISTSRQDWTIRVEKEDKEYTGITLDPSQSEVLEIVLRPINFEDDLGVEETFSIKANSIPPGDGFASATSIIVIDEPPERLTDLSISIDDVLINNKPFALLQPSDLQEGIPIVIQLTVNNNGGKSTGVFGVSLYQGSRVIDEFVVEQGVRGFSSVPVILNWDNPSNGDKNLKIHVDFKQQTDEPNSKRTDNTLPLELTISEKLSSSSEEEDSDDSMLFAPNLLFTVGVLSLISVIYRRKK